MTLLLLALALPALLLLALLVGWWLRGETPRYPEGRSYRRDA